MVSQVDSRYVDRNSNDSTSKYSRSIVDMTRIQALFAINSQVVFEDSANLPDVAGESHEP